MAMTQLFDAQTADGNSSAVRVVSVSKRVAFPGLAGETFTVIVSGDFEGATVKLQCAPDSDGPWVDLPDGSFTDDGVKVTPLSRRAWIRANMSSASASPETSVSVWVG